MSSLKLSPDQKELILKVNALLMTIHYDDEAAFNAVVEDAGDDIGSVLIGSVLMLKEMFDKTVEALEEHTGLDLELDFPDLIRQQAENILSVEEC